MANTVCWFEIPVGNPFWIWKKDEAAKNERSDKGSSVVMKLHITNQGRDDG